MSLDPVKPYADLAKVIAISVVSLLLIAALFMGGRAVGKGQSTRQLAAKDVTIATKVRALAAAETSLRASAAALRAVNAEAKRRIDEADKAEDAAKLAGVVAAGAKAAADKRMAALDREIDRARNKPSCRALLDANVRAVCGF